MSLLPFSSILQLLANARRQEKEIKCIQIGKEEIRLYLFADNVIVYVRTYQTTRKKNLLELINNYNNVVRYNANK